jgi:hypothetical protein
LVIPLFAMYIIGLFGLVVLWVSRQSLKVLGKGDVSKRKKYLYCLNWMGFLVTMVSIIMILLMDVLAIRLPMYMWPQFIEFLNEALGSNPFYGIYMNSANVIFGLLAGYASYRGNKKVPADFIDNKEMTFILLLIVLTGILGLITRILI